MVSKIDADFEAEKVMIFDEKSMLKLLEFFACVFYFCWFVFEKCLMQNNVLKQMNFNDFRVRAVRKIIEKMKNIPPKNSLEQVMN